MFTPLQHHTIVVFKVAVDPDGLVIVRGFVPPKILRLLPAETRLLLPRTRLVVSSSTVPPVIMELAATFIAPVDATATGELKILPAVRSPLALVTVSGLPAEAFGMALAI